MTNDHDKLESRCLKVTDKLSLGPAQQACAHSRSISLDSTIYVYFYTYFEYTVSCSCSTLKAALHKLHLTCE